MQAFGWYVNRIKQMSPGEVIYRLRQAAVQQAQARGFGVDVHAPLRERPLTALHWLADPLEVEKDAYLRAAQRVMNGRMSLFALIDAPLGDPPNWNKDPRTGREAPLTFGKKLDYRDQRLVGDIKYLWEPNRHLQLVTLAQAYKLTASLEYLHALRSSLESWFQQCPYLKGPNWASSLELGIRLINWAFAWQLIGGAASTAFAKSSGASFRDSWLTSIYHHMRFIAGHLSRFSSANNHLIGELTGLFVAGCVWPFCKEIEAWRARGYDMLVREALLQTGADGVNREQSVGYQQYVMDYMLIAAVAGGAAGIEFPQAYWARLERMMDFIASLMDVRGNVPMIGDADDGYAVRLSQEPDFCPFKSLLATGAVLFARGDLKAKAGRLDDKTKWLLGQQAQAYVDLPADGQDPPEHKAFVEGGYYILGADLEQANEIRLIVDAGPLGYPSIAAHGHADALSVILSIGGRGFLIDPGTYAYHTKDKWRNYFRGTAAHNTVRVDETDQSVSGGNFMWVRHATARCEVWSTDEQADFFAGSHDGYRRLADPVIHRRQIRLDKKTKRIEIEDRIICKGAHAIESAWHFSEDCTVVERDDAFQVENAGRSIVLSRGDNNPAARKFYGDRERPAGWISRRYDVKLPTTTIVWRMQIVGDTRFRTLIDCSPNEPADK